MDKITAEHSILFLGSGFSTESTNRLHKAPPTGVGLARSIAGLVSVSAADYSLADLAEFCNDIKPEALHDLVVDSFRIVDLSKNQKAILAAPWLRIYTTNFDDAAEVGRQLAGLKVSSYSFESEKPRKIAPSSVIHLHGVVRDVDRDNVLGQIVLGEKAYVQTHISLSPWYDQFLYDLRIAQACYFVGYSLADQHISALLTKNPSSRNKTFFIEPDKIPDRLFANRIQKFGEIEPIGIEGFALLVKLREAPTPISSFRALRSFKVMEVQPDSKTAAKPTVSEVRDFLINGKINISRLISSLPTPIYALPRQAEIERAANVLSTNRSLVVDARLGNGKSVFLQLLNAKLVENGYTCLLVKNVDEVSASEIIFLKSQKNIVIFFDVYAVAQSLIESLAIELPDAKFVIEVRSSLFDVRMFEIDQKVPRPFGRVSLNRLSEQDQDEFLQLSKSAGVVVPKAAVERATELRELLLAVFENEAIRKKIRTDLSKTFEHDDSRKIVIVVFLMQLVQASLDVDFLRLVTGLDPFDVLGVNLEGSQEVLTLADGSVALRSSIFAEFAMREFVPTSDLSSAIHDCAIYCANRKKNRRYRTLLTLFMQYSRIRPLYTRRSDGIDMLRALYERLRWYNNIEDEPLFWLQFGILELDEGHLSEAKRYLEFAYDKGKDRDGFLTYQIDTQYLRLPSQIVSSAEHDSYQDVIPRFIAGIRTVGAMLAEDSHRHFAFSVLDKVPEAVSVLLAHLQDGERSDLRLSIESVVLILENSSSDFLAQTGGLNLARRLKANLP